MKHVIVIVGVALLGLTGCGDNQNTSVCGDGVVDPGEGCDDGNNTDGDGTCQADCSLPSCGDGIVDPGEDCDDGAESAACNADCTTAACGDGAVNAAAGEVCDDGNTTDLDGCSANCLSDETCGNQYLDTTLGETCDDGNTTTGDGCSDTCAAEPYQICSTDVPIAIADNMTVSSSLLPPFPYQIASIDVELDITHTLLGDLTINLSHGATTVLIADNFVNQDGNACTGDDMLVIVDDEATMPLEGACVEPGPPAISGRYSPKGNLSDFAGADAAGDWSLAVTDSSTGEVGSIDRWCLNLNGYGVPAEATVFWANFGASLWRADGNGDNAGEILTGTGSAVAVDPVTGTIFFDRGTAIARANLDGSNPVDIVTGVGTIGGLAVDSVNGKLYWTDFNADQVRRSDLDGANQELVVGTASSPSGLALDVANSKVYFITYNNTGLYAVNYDGTGLTTLAASLGGQGVGVAVDSSTQKVYYSLRGNDIYVRDTDGSNPVTLVTGQGMVTGLGVDVASGKVYWVAAGAGMIRRADLADGGNVEDVSASNGNTWHLAVLPASAP